MNHLGRATSKALKRGENSSEKTILRENYLIYTDTKRSSQDDTTNHQLAYSDIQAELGRARPMPGEGRSAIGLLASYFDRTGLLGRGRAGLRPRPNETKPGQRPGQVRPVACPISLFLPNKLADVPAYISPAWFLVFCRPR